MNKVMLKWTPAVPLPNKDNIISSGAKANNEKGFTPTYETEGRPNMYCLLNNEYMRIWFRERGKYEKEVYTKKEMMKEESKIKRRFVQKDLTRKEKKKTLPVIKLKRFQNIASKTDHHQEVKYAKEEKTPTIEENKSDKEEKKSYKEEKKSYKEEKKSYKEEKKSYKEEKKSDKEEQNEVECKEKIIGEVECEEKIIGQTESKQTTQILGREPCVGEEVNQVQETDEIEVSRSPITRCKSYRA